MYINNNKKNFNPTFNDKFLMYIKSGKTTHNTIIFFVKYFDPPVEDINYGENSLQSKDGILGRF